MHVAKERLQFISSLKIIVQKKFGKTSETVLPSLLPIKYVSMEYALLLAICRYGVLPKQSLIYLKNANARTLQLLNANLT